MHVAMTRVRSKEKLRFVGILSNIRYFIEFFFATMVYFLIDSSRLGVRSIIGVCLGYVRVQYGLC